ncbi:hypothetical protein N0V90_002332 [Kalmusia sp. IMI 367209]|nr:hypothetical protein N0V90_002332 [Kalmusia sp. IMI 367209]
MFNIPLFLIYSNLALAARPFLNEPDTGLDDLLGHTDPHVLPNLDYMASLPDFEWVARRYLDNASYAWYRSAAGGEWSYRNNMEVFDRIKMKPRVMVHINNVKKTLPTKILGYNFSAPFFISPAAKAGYAHPDAEKGLVEGSAAGDILYVVSPDPTPYLTQYSVKVSPTPSQPSMRANLSIEQIAALKPNPNQVLFQQLYVSNNISQTFTTIRRAEKAGYKAFFLTVDAPASASRPRAHRLGWETYALLQNATHLPIVPKGILTLSSARAFVAAGAPAIYLSNHGGRQLDASPSAVEAAIEIHRHAPEIFKQVEVYADGGVRSGTDVLKLLALGVRAVGLGRPFMYANVYGTEGVSAAVEIMKMEIGLGAANVGVGDLKGLDESFIDFEGF